MEPASGGVVLVVSAGIDSPRIGGTAGSKNKPKPTLCWHYDPMKHPFTFAITEASAKQQQNMLIHKHLAAKSGRDKI